MKRFFVLFIATVLMLSTLWTCPIGVGAAMPEGAVSVFADGSYCITTIEEEYTNESSRATGTKTGTKTSHYYNVNDELQFSVAVRGTFTYDGTTATAISSSYAYSITNTVWSFVSGHSYAADDCAVGTCTFYCSSTGNKTYSAILYCTPTGELT